jgi:hypothetical protein
MKRVQLSEQHITYLLTILRSSDRPKTTAELIEALRSQ